MSDIRAIKHIVRDDASRDGENGRWTCADQAVMGVLNVLDYSVPTLDELWLLVYGAIRHAYIPEEEDE